MRGRASGGSERLACSKQVPTGTIKTDRRGRRRGQQKGKRMVLLVALGLWADGSGRREILEGEFAEGETRSDWQRLLDRRWQRGVRPEAGLQAVIRDCKGEPGAAVAQVYGTRVIEKRGVFHKLRNVADKAREDLGGEAHHFTAGTHQSRIAPQVSIGLLL